MPNSTTKQFASENLTAWALFEAMRLNSNISPNNLHGMQQVFREFAMMIILQQPYTDKIVAGSTKLMSFPNADYSSKQSYIQAMSKPGAWLDDAALYPALEALGYQPVMHLANTHLPPYVPFVQQESDTPLRIDIVNYGATKGGFHWELKGHKNPGGGNCGAYSIAQQMQKDYSNIASQLDQNEIATIQSTLNGLNTYETSIAKQLILKMVRKQESNVVTREITRQFKAIEENDHKRRTITAAKLDVFSTLQLAAIYNIALEVDADYLAGRMHEIEKETGIDISDVVKTGKLDDASGVTEIIREELIHALSMEAYRCSKAFSAFQQLDASTFDSNKAYTHTSANAGNDKSCREQAHLTEDYQHTDTEQLVKAPRLVV